MKKFYHSLKEMQRYIFWIAFLEILAVLLSSFCFFIGYPGIPLGFLLGGMISVINFLLIIKQSEACLSSRKPKGLAFGFYTLRYFLYGAGIALALTLDHFHLPYLSWFTVLGAYMLQKIAIIVYGLKKGDSE